MNGAITKETNIVNDVPLTGYALGSLLLIVALGDIRICPHSSLPRYTKDIKVSHRIDEFGVDAHL